MQIGEASEIEIGDEKLDVFYSLKIHVGGEGFLWMFKVIRAKEKQGKQSGKERGVWVFVQPLCGSSIYYPCLPFKLIWFLELIPKPNLAVFPWRAAFVHGSYDPARWVSQGPHWLLWKGFSSLEITPSPISLPPRADGQCVMFRKGCARRSDH